MDPVKRSTSREVSCCWKIKKANKSGIALKYGPVDGGLWASISGSIINLLCY